MFTICGVIENLRWTQIESTSKIIMVRSENASFGYNLIFEIWISEGSGPATGGPSDFQILSLEENALHRLFMQDRNLLANVVISK